MGVGGRNVAQKSNICIPSWPGSFTPRYIPKGNETIFPQKACTRMLIAASFVIPQAEHYLNAHT